MADSAVYIELASAGADTFSNSRLDDVNIFPKYATQNILLGTSNSDVSTMVITSNGVAVRKSLPSYTFDVLGDSFISGNVYTSFDVSPVYYSYPPPASTSSFTTSNVTISSQAYGNGFYVISSSSSIDQFQPAFRAFDNSITTPWQSAQRYAIGGSYTGACNTSASGGCNYTGEWIDITLPTSISLSNIRMAVNGSLGYAPNQFVFLGTSNTGSNWVTLMSASNFNGWVSSPANSNSSSSFAISTSNFYNRYRLVVQRVSNLDLVTINYMSLDGTTSNASTPFVGVGTSNPTVKFHVAGKILSDTQVLVTSNDSTNAPGFAYNGDSNTGFFHAATGNIGFVSQGTEQIRFAGTGRLGVATSNPACRVCVADYDGTNETSQYAILQVTQNSNGNALGNSNQALLALHRSNAYRVGMGFVKGSNIFGFGHAQLSNTDFIPTLLSINSNGNVGILNTTPAEALHVAGKIYGSNQILSSTANDTSNVPGFSWREDSNTGMFHPATSTLGFSTAGVSRMFINSNVGIGTSTPAYRLDVAGDINFTGTLRSNGVAFVGGSGGSSGSSQWSNNGATVYITGSNVGIGTASPSEVLHVSGGKVYSDIQVLGSSNDSVSVPSFSFKEESNTGMFHAATSVLGFTTAGTERMRIDNNGNVGIGVSTNSTARLYVFGNPSVFSRGNSNINSPAARLANTIGTPALCFSTIGIADSDDKARIGLRMNATSNAGTLTFFTGVSNALVENMCIDNNGNVGIGTTAPATMLHTSGGNITFETGDSIVNPSRTTYINFIETGFNDRCGILTEFAGVGNTNRISITTNVSGSVPTSNDARLTVVQDGNVGIGTLAPTTRLDVNGTINATAYQGTTITNLSNMALFGSNTASWSSNNLNNLVNKAGDTMTGSLSIVTTLPIFALSNASGQSVLGIASSSGNFSSSAAAGDVTLRASTTGRRLFLQTGTGGAAICINSNNTIGINTPTPVEQFHVNGKIFGSNQVLASSTNDTSNVPAFSWRENSNTGMYHHATDSIGFCTGGISRVVVDNSGNVGIGTTSPSFLLDVNGEVTARNANAFRLRQANFSTFWRNDNTTTFLLVTASNNPDGNWNSLRPFALTLASGVVRLADTMTLSNAGNIVIDSGRELIVTSSNWTGRLQLFSSETGGSNASQLNFVSRGAASAGWQNHLVFHCDNFNGAGINFVTPGAVSRIFLNGSNGTVGIGTTSALERLHVNGKVYGFNQILTSTENDTSNVPGFSWREDSNTGMFHPATSALGFSTAGVSRMFIDSSGNVGVGLSNPSQRLHVSGNTIVSGTISAGDGALGFPFAPSYNGIVVMNSTYGAGSNVVIQIGRSNANNDSWFLLHSHASNSSVSNAFVIAPYGSGNVLTLQAGGNVGIGTSTPSFKLHVAEATNSFVCMRMSASNTSLHTDIGVANTTNDFVNGALKGDFIIKNTTGCNIHFANSQTSLVMTISTNNVGIGTVSPSQKLHVVGNIFATGDIVAFSDKRLKSNITLIDSALARVHKLNGYIFNVKGDTTDRRHTGLIAQEVKEVLPEAIYKNPDDDMYSIAYGNVSGLLVQAIKEIDTKYKRQFASMKKKIHTLQNQVNQLRRYIAIIPC
jgi:hypothetical protein